MITTKRSARVLTTVVIPEKDFKELLIQALYQKGIGEWRSSSIKTITQDPYGHLTITIDGDGVNEL
jgi:hypothetical protein